MKRYKIFEIEVAGGQKCKVKPAAVSNGTLDPKLFASDLSGFREIPSDDKKYKDGPYFCMGPIDGDVRSNAGIRHISVLAYDIDEQPKQAVEHTRDLLKQHGIEFILYTTARHNPDQVDPDTKKPMAKYRLVIPLDEPITTAQFKTVYHYVASEYKIEADANTVKLSQPFYLPTIITGNKEHGRSIVVAGKPLKIDEDVLKLATETKVFTASSTQHPMPWPPGTNEALFLSALYESIEAKNQDRDEWFEVLRAVHHQTQGRAFEAFNIWSSYDKRVGKYNEDKVRKEWDECKDEREGGGVTTMKSLLRRNTNQGGVMHLSLMNQVIGRLMANAENPKDLERLREYAMEEVVPKPNEEEMTKYLAEGFRKAKKKLMGLTLTAAEARVELQGVVLSDSSRDYFRDRFCYINGESRKKYFEIATRDRMTKDDFNNYQSRNSTVKNKDGVYTDIAKVLSNHSDYNPLKVCVDEIYDPQDANTVITRDGKHYINTFDHRMWPVPDKPFDPLGDPIDSELEEMINTHFKILANGENEMATYLKQYLAHLRQHPGTRIFHAFCITSKVGGIGKSLLKLVYEKALGKKNIGHLTKDLLAATFDDYRKKPVLITFCDEFDENKGRLDGPASSLIAKLKEPITSTVGSLNLKNRDSEEARFYSSYALFSNDEAIMGEQAGDRRWSQSNVSMIKRQPRSKIANETLDEALGQPRDQFFDRYKHLLEKYPLRVAALFESIDLTGFSLTEPYKSKTPIVNTASYEYCIAKTLDEELEFGTNDLISQEIVQVTELLAAANSAWILENGEDNKPKIGKFRKEALNVLSDLGYEPMGAGRMTKLGKPTPTSSGAFYFRPPKDLVERGLSVGAMCTEVRKRYN